MTAKTSLEAKIRLAGLNHTIVPVSDVEKALWFYRDLLGMRCLPRPDFDIKGAWMVLPDNSQLHLALVDEPTPPKSIRHVALEVADIQETVQILRATVSPSLGIPCGLPRTRWSALRSRTPLAT